MSELEKCESAAVCLRKYRSNGKMVLCDGNLADGKKPCITGQTGPEPEAEPKTDKPAQK